MSEVKPYIRTRNQPSLTETLSNLKVDILKSLNCVRPGVIQSFDAADQTATVRVAQQQVMSITGDGTKQISEFPLLAKVPVQFPAGGGFTLTFPVNAGDECIVLFNDRQLDNWFTSGPGLPPSVPRFHDLSDGLCIVGIRNSTRSLAGVSTSAVQLRSDDGQTLVDLSPGKIQLIADEVVIHGRNKTTFDAGGTGFVYTPSSIDTYTNGITPADHVPHPPEVPT